MMRTLLSIIGLLLALNCYAQSPVGAWEGNLADENGVELRLVVIFSEAYQVATQYRADNGAFVNTNGGSWSLEGSQMTEVVEFDSSNPERVGTSISFEIEFKSNDQLTIKGSDLILKRLDSGAPGDLAGAWLMSGRKRNGQIQTRDTSRSRKTMKILSGTRFQWIAYDTQTKAFKGTGGGTYTTIDGTYTEFIEFFSRDDSRVGADLSFKYELIDGTWHHSGRSSKGQPLYELWSLRN